MHLQGITTNPNEIDLFITDITKHKEDEEAVRNQSQVLELTSQLAKVGGWELDLSTMKVTWSKETGRLHEVDENYAAPVLDTGENWYPPEAWLTIKAAVMAAIQEGKSYDLESPFITAKGRRIWVRVQGFPVIENEKTVKLIGTFQDISERKTAEEFFRLSEQRLNLALAGVGDGIWDWNILTNEVYYSPEWERMFGFNPGEVPQTVESMGPQLHPDDAPGLFAEVNRYLNHEVATYSHEARMFHKSGEILHTLHRASAIFDSTGKAIRMIGTTVDISLRKKAELELKLALQGAQSASLAKAEFLTSMSHEIRTPMNGVAGLTQLLQETPLNDEQKDLVRTINSSGNLLLTLLNDILDFSKMESRKLEIEQIVFEPKLIVAEIQKSMIIATRAKGINFKVQISDQMPSRLISDPSRLRQIIFNLVGNAIKFTDHGGITVKMDWLGNLFRLEVQDTGMGIAKEKQELIFQRFVQADSSTARKQGGSGLGLAISKRLVQLMGGEMGLTSELGKGSNFWFTIPMELPGQESAIEFIEKESGNKQQLTKLTEVINSAKNLLNSQILLVEDNIVNQKVALGILKKFGCQVDVAQNGLEAVDKAFITNYHLILMDCEMPEMDGYDATREIRRREIEISQKLQVARSQRKIVALTANVMPDNRAKCTECGMNGFLPKPLKRDDLQQVLAETFLN